MNSEDDLSAVSLPDRYIALAAAHVEDVLASQCEDGSFPSPRGVRPFAPHAQNGIHALAFLYRTEHPHNPFAGDKRLLDAVVRCGDFLAGSADDEGKFHYDSRGYESRGVDQWLCHAWLEAFLLVREELGAERAALWRKKLHAAAGTLSEAVREWVALEGPYHTRSFETSPNHAVTRAAFVYRAGMVFDETEWCRVVDEFMPRFFELQDADGCWPEYEGPVINYALVSLTGVGLYYEYTGDEAACQAIERTIPFIARALYPDGGGVMLLDGRQQHPSHGTAWAQFALSHTPEGRAVCDLLTRAAARGKHLAGMAFHRTIENYRCFHKGPVGRLPMQEEAFTWRLHRTAGVRKAGPWMWGLSGVITPTFAGSPWSLDRQTLVGVYHVSAGRVINGANSKENRQVATFVSLLSPDDAVPSASELDEKVSHLRVTFRTFKAELEVEASSDSSFEIVGRVSDVTQPDDLVLFHLQSAARYGTTVTVDGAARALGDDAWEMTGVRTLSWGDVALSFDAPARVWWPFKGYNSYSADHTYADLKSARLIVGLSMRADDPERRVRVVVSS